MGRNALKKFFDKCPHDWQHIFEDDILMGCIYYGDECKKCGATRNTGPGPLDLGTYK